MMLPMQKCIHGRVVVQVPDFLYRWIQEEIVEMVQRVSQENISSERIDEQSVEVLKI